MSNLIFEDYMGGSDALSSPVPPEPTQEPVAWMLEVDINDGAGWCFSNIFHRESDAESARLRHPYLHFKTRLVPLFASPPVAEERGPEPSAQAVEFGPTVGSGWRPSVPRWERNVKCPGKCGYQAIEYWQRGAITGVCTKCGHCWGTSRAPHAASEPTEKP